MSGRNIQQKQSVPGSEHSLASLYVQCAP